MRRLLVLLLFLPLSFSAIPASEEEMAAEIYTLRKQAEAGDVDAQYRLANALETGNGIAVDKASALRWWQRAAARGNNHAQYRFGLALIEQQRPGEGLAWIERAAQQGHAQAANTLGYFHEYGKHGEINLRTAYVHYLQAAELGWAEAMWNLANMYGSGQYLGHSNLLQACIWGRRAGRFAGQNEDNLRQHLGQIMPIIEQSLDEEDQAACRKLGDEWVLPGKSSKGSDKAEQAAQ